LAVTRRRTSHCAKVAWQTKETGRKMSGHPRIAWHKRSVSRRNCIRTKYEERIRRLRECADSSQRKNGMADGGRRPLYQKKKVPTKNAIGACRSGQRLHLGRRKTHEKTFNEIVCVKIAKQIVRSSVSL
jgi:hypothetical protein